MINVEFFPVDKILNDQMLICVEGFSVDNLRSSPLSAEIYQIVR